MKIVRLKRPKRLWVAALMNILVGVISLVAFAFFSTSARVPDAVLLGGGTAAGFLVASSVLALMGKPRWRQLMLAAALAFYGSILVQNAYILAQIQDSIVPAGKPFATVVRSGLEIAINLWALLSPKTRRYFGASLAAP